MNWRISTCLEYPASSGTFSNRASALLRFTPPFLPCIVGALQQPLGKARSDKSHSHG